MPSSDEPCTNLEENRLRDSNGASHVNPVNPRTPLPTRQIAILWYLQLCEPIANTVIYPFVNEVSIILPNVTHSIHIANGSPVACQGSRCSRGRRQARRLLCWDHSAFPHCLFPVISILTLVSHRNPHSSSLNVSACYNGGDYPM
jgi:hypothetical protein